MFIKVQIRIFSADPQTKLLGQRLHAGNIYLIKKTYQNSKFYPNPHQQISQEFNAGQED